MTASHALLVVFGLADLAFCAVVGVMWVRVGRLDETGKVTDRNMRALSEHVGELRSDLRKAGLR